MFLNTIAEGGELEFPDQNLKIPAVEGRAVIFPAQWMYSHRSLPASSDRYVFNLFYGFMPPPPA
jgi:anti-sigma factor ChrR (cupin superfamily)